MAVGASYHQALLLPSGISSHTNSSVARFSPAFLKHADILSTTTVVALHNRSTLAHFHGLCLSINTRNRQVAFFANENVNKESEVQDIPKSTTEEGQNPPILTIAAGVLVFLLVSWPIVSILSWLVRFLWQR